MSLNWQNVVVKINGSGIKAQSVSFSNQSSLSPTFALGYKGSVNDSVNGPQTSEISINYTPQADQDPNWGILNQYKAQTLPELQPYLLNIGGISGMFYLNSYSINFQPNNLVGASVSYRCFSPISGELTALTYENEEVEFTGFFNGLTVSVDTTDPNILGPAPQENNPPVYALNYDTALDINPVYVIGNKFPIDVQLNGGEEKFSLLTNKFNNQTFSGKTLQSLINYNTTQITAYTMGILNGSNNSRIYINFSGGIVNNTSFDVSVGGYTYITYNCTKQF